LLRVMAEAQTKEQVHEYVTEIAEVVKEQVGK
jgi:phosphoglucosamine mutase